MLVSPELFAQKCRERGGVLTTRVNGEVRQSVDVKADMVFGVGEVLSHMSQGMFAPLLCAFMMESRGGAGLI